MPSLTFGSIIKFGAVSALATLIVGWVVFFGAPDLWEYTQSNLSGVDWRPIFLWIFLAFYFVAGIWVWQELLPIFHGMLRDSTTTRLSLLFVAPLSLAAPAWVIVAASGRFAMWAVESSLSSILHDEARRVVRRSVGALALIWVSVYLILLFSNLWQPVEDQCKWVFPRIMTCLLTKHDGLSGGVVGAAGAIFAGWLAWAALQEQRSPSKPDGPKPRSLAAWLIGWTDEIKDSAKQRKKR